jgi:hypothetical protein
MKLANNFSLLTKNKFLGIIYIFLILLNTIVLTAANTRSHKRKFKHRTSTLCDLSSNDGSSPPVRHSRTFDVEKPLSKFAIGFFEGLIGNKVGWYDCLPDKYFVETPNLQQEGFVQEKFNNLSDGLKKFGDRLHLIVDFVCYSVSIRKAVIKLYAWLFKKGSSTTRFLEGKFMTKGSNSQDESEMNEWFKENKTSLKLPQFSNFSEKLRSRLGEKLETLKSFGSEINQFKNKLKEFLNQPIVQEILCVGKCVISITSAAINLYNIAQLIESFTISALTKAGFVYIARFVWNLICNYEKFVAAINAAALALNETTNQKYFYWGKVMGLILNILGTSAVLK